MDSLIKQKARVAGLRYLYEKETDPMIKELRKCCLASARLLHDIVEYGVLEPERVKPNIEKILSKPYRRIYYAVIVISIAVILAILFFSGCHTVSGIGRDLSTWSSPYIQEK